MRFIKLTDETGRACYIDAELIEAVAGINYKDSPCRSRINSISDNAYYVQESPEVIIAMLEQMVAADDVDEPTEDLKVKLDAKYREYRCRYCEERLPGCWRKCEKF